jgi:hypothetical protein
LAAPPFPSRPESGRYVGTFGKAHDSGNFFESLVLQVIDVE